MTALWTDRGGTFTDIVRRRADGSVTVDKVLSDRGSVATDAGEIRRGTTVATNALLERTGVPVLLLTTRGFGDAPWIGDQVRPALFGLRQDRPPPPCQRVIEVDGRIAAPVGDGQATLLEPHAVDRDALVAARAAGIDAVAIVLVHGALLPAEEDRLATLCREAGFAHVSVGHEVAPSRGYLSRLHTTLADAALTPLLPRQRGEYMKSDGGLAPVDAEGRGAEWRGSHAVLSGPAGGVVATARLATLAGIGAAFGLDMGGTSTDVCRVAGRPDRVDHVEIAGVRLRVPAVAAETVAAGGGSVLARRGGAYVSGPASAGADPGPACYGRGGPATVTDCAAVLGLLPDFPPIAGPDRDQPLDQAAARDALAALDPTAPPEVVAEGFQRVAVEEMARAVRRLAAARGVDPATHALVAFGGAGPGHACAVARALGIRTILVPHLAGVFSAVGIGLARQRAARTVPVRTTLGAAHAELLVALQASGIQGEDEVHAVLRYRGTSEGIPVPLAQLPDDAEVAASTSTRPATTLVDTFHAAHAELFGFHRPGLPVELVELRGARTQTARTRELPAVPLPGHAPATTRAFVEGEWRDIPLLEGTDAHGLVGPAILRVHGATVVVAAGFSVSVHGAYLRLDDLRPTAAGLAAARHPVHTAVFGTRLMAVAEQMGERLARLARSVNIRQRRDFSCAVFDAAGQLVANAPHVPVHLGAMGATVRALLAARGADVAAGTAWASNDPYAGGSHLPDITVIMPVVHAGRRIALVACRGHHVDVGGITPGSMPPHATDIAEEGFCIRHEPVLRGGRLLRPAALARDATDGGSRQPDDVVADLAAQVAACTMGAAALVALAEELGADTFSAQLGHLQDLADDAVSELLPALPAAGRATGFLDAGPQPPHPFSLSWSCDGRAATLALAGAPHRGNLNAPRAVATACLLYVMRCLLQRADPQGAALPLNEGALRRIRLEVDAGGLFDPRPPAAVAGGNVETSQRLVDALLASVGALAGSQGTMNNLTIGTDAGAFYETIGGGMGAGPGHDGADAIQVHMTNTRATDVEELEARYPMRLLRVERRRGSGGAGRWRGGDGVVKEWLFLSPATISLLAGRRHIPAPGAEGGAPGALGADAIDVGGGWRPIPPTVQVPAGSRLRIATPGGGGWGPPDGGTGH